jgi:hypothetical protein
MGYDPNTATNIYLNNGGVTVPVAALNTTFNTCEVCVNLATGKSSYLLNGVNIGSNYSTSVPVAFAGQPATWFGLYLRANSQAWTATMDDLTLFLRSN